MGEVIRFPLERRSQTVAERAPEYVQEPGWFGVRLRPDDLPVVYATPGMNVVVTEWCGRPVKIVGRIALPGR